LLGAWIILIGLSTQAFGKITPQEIQSLVDRYGKKELIWAVLKIRNNVITVQVKSRMREFMGPPSPEFITVETLLYDLNKADVDARGLEEVLRSPPEPSSHRARVAAISTYSSAPQSPQGSTLTGSGEIGPSSESQSRQTQVASPKASTPKPSSSARNPLWSVRTGKNTLYLLGSLHLMRGDSYPLSDEIEKAYAQCQKVVFETDIEAITGPAMFEKMMALGVYPSDQTLAQGVSGDTYDSFRKKITALGLPMAQFERLRPWVSALMIIGVELLKLGFDPNLGVDRYFFNKAKQDNKECAFLETMDEQMALFANMNESEQEAFLRQTLKDLDILETLADQMETAWKTGDADKLGALMQMSFKEHPSLYRRLVTQRNEKWIKPIERLMNQEENVLVVVGAGHLVGSKSVIDLLQARGHKAVQM
jgi:uncharacterized protein YbaP (TraB family)